MNGKCIYNNVENLFKMSKEKYDIKSYFFFFCFFFFFIVSASVMYQRYGRITTKCDIIKMSSHDCSNQQASSPNPTSRCDMGWRPSFPIRNVYPSLSCHI